MNGVLYHSGITPWTVGDTSPAWQVTLIDNRGKPLDLSNVLVSELSLRIYNSAFVYQGNGAGTFSIPAGTVGTLQYQPAASDSATPGTYYLKFRVNFGNTEPLSSSYVEWVVQP
jgi:hypothetical protein